MGRYANGNGSAAEAVNCDGDYGCIFAVLLLSSKALATSLFQGAALLDGLVFEFKELLGCNARLARVVEQARVDCGNETVSTPPETLGLSSDLGKALPSE